MYKVGEYVVKVNNGVCRVEDIVDMALSGNVVKKYYLMVPKDDRNAKLYVPVDGENGNVRNVMKRDEALAFIERVPEMAEALIESDKLREQEYKAAIRSGSPEQLVGIIKNIYFRNMARSRVGKKNTTIDERYYKMAENILYSELAFALNREKEEILKLITGAIETKYS